MGLTIVATCTEHMPHLRHDHQTLSEHEAPLASGNVRSSAEHVKDPG